MSFIWPSAHLLLHAKWSSIPIMVNSATCHMIPTPVCIPYRCSYNSTFLLSISCSYFLPCSENKNVLEIRRGNHIRCDTAQNYARISDLRVGGSLWVMSSSLSFQMRAVWPRTVRTCRQWALTGPNAQPVASSPIILKTTHEVDGDSSSILELTNWCTERLGNLPKDTQLTSVSR